MLAFKFKRTYYIFILMLVANLISILKTERNSFHPECGESPIHKYRELAKAIGWEVNQLIRFMRAEKHDDYEKLIRAVKQYADCIALSQIPIK